MRTPMLRAATCLCLSVAWAPSAPAQVDEQRAQQFFSEAKALCKRDGGRLWGVSICAPMVIGDARTQTFATSQAPPNAPRPKLVGILMGPVQWGDAMWAAVTWDGVANQQPRVRDALLLHESFHIVQPRLGLGVGTLEAEHLDLPYGRYWMRLEWRALAQALRFSGGRRAAAVRDALAFRQARHARFPDKVDTEHALEINEGLASYTGMVLAAHSRTEVVADVIHGLEIADSGASFVRTFAYASGPAYGLLLDAASPGWTRRIRASDDLAVLLQRALGVRPAPDPGAASVRYGGPAVRAAEAERERDRQVRIAELRRRFIDGPVFLMPGGGHGFSDSHGAMVIPGEGTVYFGDYRQNGEWGSLDAKNGVLLSTDGSTRRLPAPVPGDSATISGDGWTFKAAAGWVIRGGSRQGDFVVVKQ